MKMDRISFTTARHSHGRQNGHPTVKREAEKDGETSSRPIGGKISLDRFTLIFGRKIVLKYQYFKTNFIVVQVLQ